MTPLTPDFIYGFDDGLVEVAFREPAPVGSIPEALLHDLWQTQQFDQTALQTADGQPLAVLNPGAYNRNAGPDFRNAQLRIGGTLWHGDVEIHTAPGEWFEHRHHLDERYNSVVLHVALAHDLYTGQLKRADGTPIPELYLQPRLTAPLQQALHRFRTRADGTLPCAPAWAQMAPARRDAWLRDLAVERIRAGQHQLAARYLGTPDVEALLHEALFAGLGYARNAEPMRQLARRLPLGLCRQLADSTDLEALHLGTAGLIPAEADMLDADRTTADYVFELRHRYQELQDRLKITPLPRTVWQFFRLRPANFPPLRIAQGVAMLRAGGLLHHDPLGTLERAACADEPIHALRELFLAAPGPFWGTHVRLERSSRPHPVALGQERIDVLLVNAVLPVLLLLAEHREDIVAERRLIDLLAHIPAPSDEVTRPYEQLGAHVRTALNAQGLHQLARTRCGAWHCLTCPAGRMMAGADPEAAFRNEM